MCGQVRHTVLEADQNIHWTGGLAGEKPHTFGVRNVVSREKQTVFSFHCVPIKRYL